MGCWTQEPGPSEEAGTASLVGTGKMEIGAVKRELEEKYLLREMLPGAESEEQKCPGFSLSSDLLFFWPVPPISENDLKSAREFERYHFL